MATVDRSVWMNDHQPPAVADDGRRRTIREASMKRRTVSIGLLRGSDPGALLDYGSERHGGPGSVLAVARVGNQGGTLRCSSGA
jgi:hypothetical protein